MTRINKVVMERMAKAIVMHAYGEQAEALVCESIDLFGVLHSREHNPTVLKHMNAILREKPGAFEKKCGVGVNLNGRRFNVGQRPIAVYWRSESDMKPCLDDFGVYPGVSVLEGDDLFDRLSAFADAEKALTDEVKGAYEEALGSLGQFSTVKVLRTNWPEVLSVVEHLLPEDNRLLPVVEVKHLNDRFKLPAVAE